MDPFSIAVGALALLQASGTVLTELYQYRVSISSAPADAGRIVDELNDLRLVLDHLFQALEENDGGNLKKPKATSLLASLAGPEGALKRCTSDLETSNAKLDDGAKEGWKRVKEK
jgi:hypothetical protein